MKSCNSKWYLLIVYYMDEPKVYQQLKKKKISTKGINVGFLHLNATLALVFQWYVSHWFWLFIFHFSDLWIPILKKYSWRWKLIAIKNLEWSISSIFFRENAVYEQGHLFASKYTSSPSNASGKSFSII